MNELRELLSARSERGEPRGADVVLERAFTDAGLSVEPLPIRTHPAAGRHRAAIAAALTVVVATLIALFVAQRDGGPAPAANAAQDRLVVLTSDFKVELIDASGRRVRTLAKDWGVRRYVPGMAVTPDGSTLYMDRDRPTRGGECVRSLVEEIVAMPLRGQGGPRVITQGRWPVVSPDGSALAYAAPLTSGGACGNPSGVIVRNLRTGSERRWTLPETAIGSGDFVGFLSWAPDSRQVAFAEFSTSTRVRVLDTARSGSLATARVVPLARGLSWSGYLGSTGQFLGVREPVVSGKPATIVAIDPETGRAAGTLVRFRRQLSDGNTRDRINEGVVADRSGRRLLITAARLAHEHGNTLYRWSRGHGLRPIGASAVVAVWAPRDRCARRSGDRVSTCDHRGDVAAAAQVAAKLESSGHSVRRVRTSGSPSGFLGTEPTTLCVDRRSVQVYEYASVAERAVQSDAIQPDGSLRYAADHSPTYVLPEWRANPHFFATGRVIVIYVGDDGAIVRGLTGVLGLPIPTDARGRGSVQSEC